MIKWALFLCVLPILQYNAWNMDEGNSKDTLSFSALLLLIDLDGEEKQNTEVNKISHPSKRKYKEEHKYKDEKLSFDLEAFIEKSDKKQKHQGKIVMKSKGDESEEIDIIN
jgi:hypothetical protein